MGDIGGIATGALVGFVSVAASALVAVRKGPVDSHSCSRGYCVRPPSIRPGAGSSAGPSDSSSSSASKAVISVSKLIARHCWVSGASRQSISDCDILAWNSERYVGGLLQLTQYTTACQGKGLVRGYLNGGDYR